MNGPIALAGLALCGSIAATSLCPAFAQEASPPSRAAHFTFSAPDLELLEEARQLDLKLEEKGLVYHDPQSTAYISAVAARVAPPGPAPENVVWNYRILRDPYPNAFALPNGSIYVHTGLLGLLQNEAQLASVLAHEQTHVLNRHSYLEYRSIRKKSVGLHVLEAMATAGSSVVGGVAGSSIILVADVAPYIVVYTVFGYSRELEKEADVRAVGAVTDAGYSGDQIPAVFRLLDTGPEVHLESEPRFYADHPKLQNRVAYTGELLKSVRNKPQNPEVGVQVYLEGTRQAVLHDINLQILSGRARSALAEAQRLAAQDPASAENQYWLGEAYRSLGPRTPVPQPAELEPDAKSHTRKMLKQMTIQEYVAALKAQPGGQAEWETNNQEAEKSYQRALELDPACAKCYRGIGLLYESMGSAPQAIEAFKKYLDLAPSAPDRIQISRHVERLEQAPAGAKQAGGP